MITEFGQIIEKHDSMIRAIVLKKMGRTIPDWEDIIQNIYLSIWIALSRFKGKCEIGTYIYPIVNCRISDYFRYFYKEKDLIKKALKRIVGSSLHEREEEIQKKKNIKFLSPAEFRVFKLIGQGLTNDEIANELYVSKNTIRSHIKKVYSELGFKKDRVKLALFAYKFLNGGIR